MNVHTDIRRANSEKWTFADDNVLKWVQERLSGEVLNACAGETRIPYNGTVHRNDVNEDRPANTHMDLRELPDELGKDRFDTVVYDPPWSVFQVNDKYEGRGQDTIKQSTQMAKAIDELLRSGGKVVAFGYTVDMIPSSMDYTLTDAVIWKIPGPGKDFLGSIHVNSNRRLGEF